MFTESIKAAQLLYSFVQLFILAPGKSRCFVFCRNNWLQACHTVSQSDRVQRAAEGVCACLVASFVFAKVSTHFSST